MDNSNRCFTAVAGVDVNDYRVNVLTLRSLSIYIVERRFARIAGADIDDSARTAGIARVEGVTRSTGARCRERLTRFAWIAWVLRHGLRYWLGQGCADD